ncbi:MAG: flagellar hook-associated protein FlgK [Candidatus Gastranaerophilales bacterium]|nr:flagellar hook-associated protein FlgK [Candidatus Gastranaerophilales bacterium]
MPSQFFGLNIAYKGLLASNAALNTTANNIANVQTDGYSRQRVVQQASDALRVFQTYGCAGAGVETLAIERVRDEFYDAKYWDNNASVGEFSMKQYYMRQMEDYFKDTEKNAGFKTLFDQMMITGVQEVLKNPSDSTTRAQFIGYADSLVTYFNGMAGNLKAMQKDVNQEIKLKVDEINSLAAEIANLNKQINTVELSRTNANELRDRRTLLLDQLSQIVDIQTKEVPIVDPTNPNWETGANRFVVTIAGGQMLVDDSEYRSLECVARKDYEKMNQTDIDGLYDVYWEDGQKFKLENATMGGNLRGLVELRDGKNGEYFHGTVTETDTVNNTVTIQVTSDYLQDLNKCNLSDQGGIINLGNREFYYDSWEYHCESDYDAASDTYSYTYSYTFTLSGSEKNGTNRLTNDREGMEASIGTSIDYQGIPYYMGQMNEWVRTFSQKVNDILVSGYTAEDMAGMYMFTGNHPVEDAQFLFLKQYHNLDPSDSVTVGCAEDSYYRLTAENFSILSAMLHDPTLLATKRPAGEGVEQNKLFEDLKNMGYDKTKMSFRGASASEFLQCVLSDVALNASSANLFYQSYSDISGSIDTQRISISGVDEDEEAVSLVKYQNAYNLAAKMVQTLTEIYDKLILDTGV